MCVQPHLKNTSIWQALQTAAELTNNGQRATLNVQKEILISVELKNGGLAVTKWSRGPVFSKKNLLYQTA